jgi:2-(1,2-epoxy-1,2-dihydrophenyl)acetyl-CoA isomerase
VPDQRIDGSRAEGLRVTTDGAVATITLDRPDALNALTVPLKESLLGAFHDAGADPAIRAIVLTGAGRAFCAGQDLRERTEPGALPLADEIRARYNPLIRAMRALDKPIVGAVNGVAAGAGASLAFACDIRLAAEGATFLLAFGRVGLVPDSGATWLLPRLIGAAKAAELALTTDPLSAADAERFGLVARVLPAETLVAEAQALAARMAAGAPIALALTKHLLDRAWDASLEDQLEAEADAQGVAGASADHAEGMAAFLERRPARFSGS